MFHPYVWDEDGTVNIRQYLDFGSRSLFKPVQGYFILVPKLINIISLKLSFYYYPEISIALSFAFSLLVLVCIWQAPTTLKGKSLCALAVLLNPNGSEVYVLPLYLCWFAGLLVALALLWDKDAQSKPQQLLRSAFILIGGLSSPLILPLAPLFLLRTLRFGRTEWPFTLQAGVVALVQMSAITTTGASTPVAGNWISLLSLRGLYDLLLKFLGDAFFYPFLNGGRPFVLVCIVALSLLYVAWRYRSMIDWTIFCCVLLYAISIVLSAARWPVAILDPFLSGPRYFFYPYVFLYWTIINFLFRVGHLEKVLLAALLLFGLYSSLINYSRMSDTISWRGYVDACLNAQSSFSIPIHFDGVAAHAWQLRMTPAECNRLYRHGLIK